MAAEPVNRVERIAARFESGQRRAGAVLVLHKGQRLHQIAHGGQRLSQLAAHRAEHVGDLIGTEDKLVEVAGVGVDRIGGLVERVAYLTDLEGQLGLLEGLASGPGDPAHDVDIGHLADPVGQLLHVGQRLRCAQVAWRVDQYVLRQAGIDGEVLADRLVPAATLASGG